MDTIKGKTTMIQLNNENATKHWEFISVKDKIVLDIGCGRYAEFVHVSKDWPTTPEHFLNLGAIKVIAVDSDCAEIDWFKNNFQKLPNAEFLCKNISSNQDIVDLYTKYNPDCVKCDIETNEKFLLELEENIFCSINEYYIETHGEQLYTDFLNKFKQYNYAIREQIDLTHTNGWCKVIFAYKTSL